jgi:hypothetical protein
MDYIRLSEHPTRRQELWWQTKNLMENATGYGNKLRTTCQVFFAGRWRRVYCRCYSNCGTNYIIVNGKEQYVSQY